MTTPQDPYSNPPGFTDPYADLTNISGDDPLPPLEPATTPPAQPPSSPLLTGLIIGLLLVALSVAVFQLLGSDDSGTAVGTTTTTDPSATTTTADGSSTTTSEPGPTTTLPDLNPYPPVGAPIPVEKQKMITNGMRINDNDIKDIVFGMPADEAIGSFVASFGDPTDDTGWRISTGAFGVCVGDFERIVTFGYYAAIVTKPGGQETYNGYRHDLNFGDAGHVASALETLSGLTVGATVAELNEIYKDQRVTFVEDPQLGTIYNVSGATSGNLLLWGPVAGTSDDDRVIGIYAPEVCGR